MSGYIGSSWLGGGGGGLNFGYGIAMNFAISVFVGGVRRVGVIVLGGISAVNVNVGSSSNSGNGGDEFSIARDGGWVLESMGSLVVDVTGSSSGWKNWINCSSLAFSSRSCSSRLKNLVLQVGKQGITGTVTWYLSLCQYSDMGMSLGGADLGLCLAQ
jgi:hypothetical protein